MEKTKKTLNLIIIAVICLVLIVGIIDSAIIYESLTRSYTTMEPSSYSSTNNLDKDGKIMVTFDVPDNNAYLYVKTTKVEVITRNEYLKRVVKNRKIVMDHANEEFTATWTEGNEISYNKAVADYELAKKNLSRTNREAFSLASTAFFRTYFTIIAFLGIAFLINQKLFSKNGEIVTKSND